MFGPGTSSTSWPKPIERGLNSAEIVGVFPDDGFFSTARYTLCVRVKGSIVLF